MPFIDPTKRRRTIPSATAQRPSLAVSPMRRTRRTDPAVATPNPSPPGLPSVAVGPMVRGGVEPGSFYRVPSPRNSDNVGAGLPKPRQMAQFDKARRHAGNLPLSELKKRVAALTEQRRTEAPDERSRGELARLFGFRQQLAKNLVPPSFARSSQSGNRAAALRKRLGPEFDTYFNKNKGRRKRRVTGSATATPTPPRTTGSATFEPLP